MDSTNQNLDKINYQQASFFISVADANKLPGSEANEVAFVGRSNSGKSSAINCICQQKKLAKTSKTPGRTQLINFFPINEKCTFVDLPGYGFAKVNNATKKQWRELIEGYLSQRENLQGLIITIDARHPLKESDLHMIEYSCSIKLRVHILLTKSDKLTRNIANQTLFAVRNDLKELFPNNSADISCQLFSAPHANGLNELYPVLSNWFNS